MQRLGWRRERLAASRKSGIRPWGYRRPESWRLAAAAEAAEAAAKARETAF